MTPTDRQRLRRYFDASRRFGASILAAVFLSIGVLLILVSGFAIGQSLIGALMIAAGALILWLAHRDLPSDHEVDEWIDSEVDGLFDKARQKCDVDATQDVSDPVVVVGRQWSEGTDAQNAWGLGADGRPRYSPLDVAILFFAESWISIYRCSLDLLTGFVLNESGQRVFYDSISSVVVQSVSHTVDRKDLPPGLWTKVARIAGAEGDSVQLSQGQEFALMTGGGTAVRIHLGDLELMRAGGSRETSVPVEAGDRAVRAVWKMVAERRGA